MHSRSLIHLALIPLTILTLVGCRDVDVPQRVTSPSPITGASFNPTGPDLGPPLERVIRWGNGIAWANTIAWNEAVARSAARPTTTNVRRSRPAPRAPRVPSAPARAARPSGSCFGWGDLIASLWPADQVTTACRVMGCESGGNPGARNPSGAIGLFQLLGHGGTTDPYQNASVAFRLWLAEGWGPWVCR